ncbi:MAG TPA: hypothetical protein VD816_00945 [Ohtaekwangia sp.]|nr:hypothetical protein [Ohtaekwangia sp.]
MAKSKKSVERVSTDLQIDEHIAMQENGWKVQAAGLFFIFLLILAAAIGLFGDGIVSSEKQTGDDIEIEHERFYRFEARMPLTIKAHGQEGLLRVSFPNEYLERFQVESILPEPNSNRFESGKVQYQFSGKDRMNITFYLIPRKPGNIQSTIEVNESRFEISHFIFP